MVCVMWRWVSLRTFLYVYWYAFSATILACMHLGMSFRYVDWSCCLSVRFHLRFLYVVLPVCTLLSISVFGKRYLFIYICLELISDLCEC